MNTHRPQPTPSPSGRTPRPWIGIYFQCCAVYARIYRNAEGSAYEGRCPRCGAPVSALVGPTGTSRRFFEAT